MWEYYCSQGEEATHVSNILKSKKDSPVEDQITPSSMFVGSELKRNLQCIYDVDEGSSQSSTKPRTCYKTDDGNAYKRVEEDGGCKGKLLIPKISLTSLGGFVSQRYAVERAKLALLTDKAGGANDIDNGDRQFDHMIMMIAYKKCAKILRENGSNQFHKPNEIKQDDSKFYGQSSLGIKTVALNRVEPQGVFQFGSTNKTIATVMWNHKGCYNLVH
ncbi:hypothetical protein L1987_33773 [Smallanthus sonchifolius]|uniref:Uncharacterized protein n=1 Tax=Smallanthus sonchifolius TaxID=185202 RepID=A0ACB9HT62_9ASTR|nr:hypothetical protein L1987_33773 [Smallanthus sonchifolius]